MPARLSLDFTTGVLDPRITFTRSGATATRFNASGVLETVAANTARFDYRYDGLAWVIAGLLIEEARTNLLLRSAEFDNASWTKIGSPTIGANAATAPDGTTSADKFTAAAAATCYLEQSVTITSGTAYTISVFAKAAERSVISLLLYGAQFNSGGSNFRIDFNLATGTATVGAGVTTTYKIENMGNGWYRCQLTATATTSGTGAYFQIRDNTAGTGAAGYYIWGAQFEAGAFATSYIPTTSATVTRNADVATIGGTSFTDFFNNSEGTVYIEFSTPNMAAATVDLSLFSFDRTDASSQRLSSRLAATAITRGTYRPFFHNGTTFSYALDAGIYSSGTARHVVAYSALNDFISAVGGTIVGTDSSGDISGIALQQVRLGFAPGSGYLNGHIRKFGFYPKRLPNTPASYLSHTGVTIADLDPAGITPSPLDLSLTYTPLVVVPVDTPASRRGIVPAESRRGIA